MIILSLLIEFPDVRTVAEDDNAGNDEVREELLVFLHVTFPTWTAIAALLVVAAADIILPPPVVAADVSSNSSPPNTL